jgi:hypothetical protein
MNFRFNRDMVRVMKVEPRAGGHRRSMLFSSTGLSLRTDDGSAEGIERPGHSIPEPADYQDHEPLLPFGHASRGIIADRRSIAARLPGPFSFFLASGTRPRRRPRVQGSSMIHGAHALGVGALRQRPAGRI